MILIDYSQISFAQVMNDLMRDKSTPVDEDFIRHLILNQIRSINMKFSREYGPVVLCMDDRNYWRRSKFEHYKALRKKNRDSSDLDWDELFRIMNTIRDEMIDFSPYPCVRVETAEADDIIAVLTKLYHPMQKTLIISSDKDFQQLQYYGENVKQYSPIQKKFVECKNPLKYLFEHIIRGDGGDGIPNALTPSDFYVNDELKRQKSVFQKKLDAWYENVNDLDTLMPSEFEDDPELARRWNENNSLINLLEQIPVEIHDAIAESYVESALHTNGSRLYSYLVKKRCKYLLSCVHDFFSKGSTEYPGTEAATTENNEEGLFNTENF